MKYKKYIENLSSMEDDFDEGLLSQLREEPPEELHGHIMKSIGREKKKRIFLNYKTYVPAIAAVFICAVILEGVNGNKNINSIIKNKKEKFETTNVASADKTNTDKNNIISNQEDPKQGTSGNVSSSTTKKRSADGEKNRTVAKKDTTVKENTSGSSNEKTSTDSKDTQTASTGKTTLGDYVGKNTNTTGGKTTNKGEDNNPSSTTPNVFEQNKKVLGFMTEFNAVAAGNNNTYKITAFEFDKLQRKITDEGIENSVLTVLSNDGEFVTFKLNVR